jgi:hypothetical protein
MTRQKVVEFSGWLAQLMLRKIRVHHTFASLRFFNFCLWRFSDVGRAYADDPPQAGVRKIIARANIRLNYPAGCSTFRSLSGAFRWVLRSS